MNKELEEAIKDSKEIIKLKEKYGSCLFYKNKSLEQILETLVQAVENSIPKEAVKEKISALRM